ncbi:hypothetical protein L2E82_08278 [Cichorium intybus]|uniref:Uncharacterized protein n=1 Tax=Cichorium intybus TaxID=13427 RepID=A0ACB9G5U1_CICIN|nr:hypothetical protein L2E82_08278 [Cichorium intybus]
MKSIFCKLSSGDKANGAGDEVGTVAADCRAGVIESDGHPGNNRTRPHMSISKSGHNEKGLDLGVSGVGVIYLVDSPMGFNWATRGCG